MRKKLSKPLIGFVTAASLLFPISVHADSYIRLDGKIVDGRTYLPLRSAGEQMKAQVGWNSKTNSATITKDGKTLTAKVGKEALLFDGRTFIHLRQLNDTFYQSEEIVWTPYRLMASTNHVIVSTAPVSDDEAINMLHNAVTKSNSLTGVPQKRTYLRPYFTDEAINQILEQGGVNVLLPITPDDPTYLKVIYYYSATGFFVSEQIEHYDGDNSVRATVIAYFINQDNRWLVKSIAYETNSISPPSH